MNLHKRRGRASHCACPRLLATTKTMTTSTQVGMSEERERQSEPEA
jgi:hypothetical protein